MIIFVPIKQNSQRVPGKNFRKIEGLTLYDRLFDKLSSFRVFVDTDSEEIFDNLKKNYENVTVYRRSEHLLGDTVSVCDLIQDFIQRFDVKDWICQVHVTSPFLSKETLMNVEKMTQENNYDSIVSCNVVQSRFWREESYGFTPVNHNPTVLEQTQDLPKYYEENSLFYAFNSENFKKLGSRVGKRPHFYPTCFPENLDIDNEEDWTLVKKIAENN